MIPAGPRPIVDGMHFGFDGMLHNLIHLIAVQREELCVFTTCQTAALPAPNAIDVQRVEKLHMRRIIRQVHLQSKFLQSTQFPSPTLMLIRMLECTGSFSVNKSFSSSFVKCFIIDFFSMTCLFMHSFQICRAYIFSSTVPHVTRRYTITSRVCPIRYLIITSPTYLHARSIA